LCQRPQQNVDDTLRSFHVSAGHGSRRPRVNHGPFGREWEERKIREIMESERSQPDPNTTNKTRSN